LEIRGIIFFAHSLEGEREPEGFGHLNAEIEGSIRTIMFMKCFGWPAPSREKEIFNNS
jgi:hypothetical protein